MTTQERDKLRRDREQFVRDLDRRRGENHCLTGRWCYFTKEGTRK